MLVHSRTLKPIECQWCSRILALVGEQLPAKLETDRLHYIVYWKGIEDRRLPFERAYARKFLGVLNAIRITAESTYRSTSSVTATTHAISQAMPSKLRTVEKQLYQEVAGYFGSHLPTIGPAKATPGEYDPFSDPAMRAWFDVAIGQRITSMVNFTVEDVRRIILNAIDAGTSLQDTVAEFETAYGLSETRATAISRTETVSASNAGNYFSVIVNIGTNLIKTWLSTQDDRTRDTHMEANAQEQDMETPFEVGGSKLLFPGDPSLGASSQELVNCRCTLFFKRAKMYRRSARR